MAIEKNNPDDQIDIQIEPDSAQEIQQPLMEILNQQKIFTVVVVIIDLLDLMMGLIF